MSVWTKGLRTGAFLICVSLSTACAVQLEHRGRLWVWGACWVEETRKIGERRKIWADSDDETPNRGVHAVTVYSLGLGPALTSWRKGILVGYGMDWRGEVFEYGDVSKRALRVWVKQAAPAGQGNAAGGPAGDGDEKEGNGRRVERRGFVPLWPRTLRRPAAAVVAARPMRLDSVGLGVNLLEPGLSLTVPYSKYFWMCGYEDDPAAAFAVAEHPLRLILLPYEASESARPSEGAKCD